MSDVDQTLHEHVKRFQSEFFFEPSSPTGVRSRTPAESMFNSSEDEDGDVNMTQSININTTNNSTVDESETRDSIGPFQMGKVLGEGRTATVRLGWHVETKLKVAIKIMDKSVIVQRNEWHKIEREVAVLKLIEHPRIVQLYDVTETDRYVYVVTEYIDGGELFDYITKKGKLDRLEALTLFSQVVEGIMYCSKYNICHRDLKPENILVDTKTNSVKIADFGMATMTTEQDAKVRTSCGSPLYASPEIVLGKSYNGTKSDVWSLGVLLYVMVTGTMPFYHDHVPTLLRVIVKGQFSMPDTVPRDVANLIRRLIVVDVDRRIQLSEIRYHFAFNKTNCFQRVSHVEENGAVIDPNELDDVLFDDIHHLGFGKSPQHLRDMIINGYGVQATFFRNVYKLALIRKSKRSQSLEVLSPRTKTRTLMPKPTVNKAKPSSHLFTFTTMFHS